MQTAQFPLAWLSANWLHVVGWITLLTFAWKFLDFFRKKTLEINHIFISATEAVATVNLMATNHLPHLQTELEKSNSKLTAIENSVNGLRDDFKVVAEVMRELR